MTEFSEQVEKKPEALNKSASTKEKSPQDKPAANSANSSYSKEFNTPKNQSVAGLTILNNTLCVLWSRCADVYVANVIDDYGITFLYSFAVRGLMTPCDMTSSERRQRLYIVDGHHDKLFKVNFHTEDCETSWTVEGTPTGLSISEEHLDYLRIFVTCLNSHSIKCYSDAGDMLNEIKLQPIGLTYPRHAIELDNGLFIVCRTPPGRRSADGSFTIIDNDMNLVCLISEHEPTVLQSFDIIPGASQYQLCGPSRVLLNSSRNKIIVVDGNSDIITLLDMSSLAPNKILLSGREGFRRPTAICQLESFLFVGLQSGNVLRCQRDLT